MSDRVTVWRAEGQPLAELLTDLIALADDPHDVRWENRGGVVTVPEYLAARYAASVSGGDDAAAGEPAGDVPKPEKRKGRPAKKATAAAVTEEVN